jgi:hypothetical protein
MKYVGVQLEKGGKIMAGAEQIDPRFSRVALGHSFQEFFNMLGPISLNQYSKVDQKLIQGLV